MRRLIDGERRKIDAPIEQKARVRPEDANHPGSRGPRRLRSGDRRKAGTYPGAPGTRRKELGAHAEDKRVGEKSESRRNSRSNPDGEDGGPRRFREIKEEIAPALGDARRRQRCFISFASMKSPRGGAPPSARAPRFSFET